MGLEERKAVEEFLQAKYPALKSEVDQAAGFPVTMEIDWPAIASHGIREDSHEDWRQVFFAPLVRALTAVTRTRLAAQALREKLKGVVIQSTGKGSLSTGRENNATFAAGVLEFDDHLTNVTNVETRAERLQETLERAIGMRPRLAAAEATHGAVMDLAFEHPWVILQTLWRFTMQNRRGELGPSVPAPVITVLLTSGQEVTGKLLQLGWGGSGNSRNDPEGVLLVDNTGMDHFKKLSYVARESVCAVIVETNGLSGSNAELTAPVVQALGNLKISPAKFPEPLVVKGRAQALGEELAGRLGSDVPVSVQWAELPETDKALASVSVLLDDIRRVLDGIAADAVGLSALREGLRGIDIRVGEEEGVLLDKGSLQVAMKRREDDVEAPGEGTLREYLNGKL